MREAALLVMPLAFVLIACGYWRNPTMVGADRLLKSEDPARGIIRITRHPIMWGFMLWAAAHIARARRPEVADLLRRPARGGRRSARC